MTMCRLFFVILFMLTVIPANPTWAQVGSKPAESAPAAGVTTRGNNSDADMSADWAKKDVKVPNVVGRWRDEAILDVFKAGLRIGDVREETSTSVAHHHVISESPAAGTQVKADSKVDLVIARAPEAKVPDVVGLTLGAAKAALDKVDLKVGRIEERPSTTVAVGLIVSQHPRAGATVSEDRRVRLVVSKGTSQDTVPNVVGATQAAATSAITGAGLIVGTVTMQSSATVAAGLVISESPTAGTHVTAGSAVNLVVSNGAPKVVVPNVVGLTQAAASTAITGVGLTVGAITMQSSAIVAMGLVISESPSAGSSVAAKSPVNLVVSSGVAEVAVPNVVGLMQAAATAAITGAGLTVGTVAMQSSATVAAGLVISESPTAGTSVPTGSAVSLIISSGPSAVGKPVAIIDAPGSVLSYATVLLDGSLSRDPTASIKSYAWKQTAGPTVALTGAGASQASFIAPQVPSPATFTFTLTVTDATGASSQASASVSVSPATASQLQPTFVDLVTLLTFSGNVHNYLMLSDGPPVIGSTATIRASLSGAVQSPTFTVVDKGGNTLSTISLTLAGSPSLQPLDFVGSIAIPTVPFRVMATGTTADGQSFSLTSPALITPQYMGIAFSPFQALLKPGATVNTAIQIQNAGAAATFSIAVSDPHHMLASPPSASVQAGANQTVSIPLTVTLPVGLVRVVNPTITATASVSGDPTRTGTATFNVWLNGAP